MHRDTYKRTVAGSGLGHPKSCSFFTFVPTCWIWNIYMKFWGLFLTLFLQPSKPKLQPTSERWWPTCLTRSALTFLCWHQFLVSPLPFEDSHSRAHSSFTPLCISHQKKRKWCKREIVHQLMYTNDWHQPQLPSSFYLASMWRVSTSQNGLCLRVQKLYVCILLDFIYSCISYSWVWMCVNECSALGQVLIFCYTQTWALFTGDGYFSPKSSAWVFRNVTVNPQLILGTCIALSVFSDMLLGSFIPFFSLTLFHLVRKKISTQHVKLQQQWLKFGRVTGNSRKDFFLASLDNLDKKKGCKLCVS